MATREAEIVPAHETALARLDPQSLISQAIEKGAGIETLERLVALAECVQKITAKQAYDHAMAEFQRECPPIFKTKEARISTRSGPGFRYTFAPLDEITSTISPIMGKYGLSFRWRAPSPEEFKPEPDRIAIICRISHAAGHYEESGIVTMPIERMQDGGSGANPMQRVGIALTYAKRYSLMAAIGRAPENDEDGASPSSETPDPGDPHAPPQGDLTRLITENQQKRLYAIARGSGWSDEDIHAKISGFGVMSGSAKDVPVAVYDELIEKLKVKKAAA
jgi:hypothetical protein